VAANRRTNEQTKSLDALALGPTHLDLHAPLLRSRVHWPHIIQAYMWTHCPRVLEPSHTWADQLFFSHTTAACARQAAIASLLKGFKFPRIVSEYYGDEDALIGMTECVCW
jgi:hypothetical protein